MFFALLDFPCQTALFSELLHLFSSLSLFGLLDSLFAFTLKRTTPEVHLQVRWDTHFYRIPLFGT